MELLRISIGQVRFCYNLDTPHKFHFLKCIVFLRHYMADKLHHIILFHKAQEL
jgi:hypothetical protein